MRKRDHPMKAESDKQDQKQIITNKRRNKNIPHAHTHECGNREEAATKKPYDNERNKCVTEYLIWLVTVEAILVWQFLVSHRRNIPMQTIHRERERKKRALVDMANKLAINAWVLCFVFIFHCPLIHVTFTRITFFFSLSNLLANNSCVSFGQPISARNLLDK